MSLLSRQQEARMSDTPPPEAPFLPFGEVEGVKRTKFQKIVARTMSANAASIPHVTHHDDVDITGLEAYRRTLPAEQRASPLIYLVKAVAAGLKAFPTF